MLVGGSFSLIGVQYTKNVGPRPVPMVLCFLQSLIDNNRAPSTLRVSVAAISVQHVKVNNQSLGSHILISRFLKSAQQFHPAPTVRVPSWDLSLVLRTLTQHPFESMEHCDLKWLSIKTGFLFVITSAKRVLGSSTYCQPIRPVCIGMQMEQW